MNLFKYLQYFFYIATNWNLGIALHILKNEKRGEKQYGIDTTGADNLNKLDERGIDITHSTIYMPASYDVLEDFLKRVDIKNSVHFLDIGFGKGRALCVAAAMGATKISGVELSKELYLDAQKNLKKTQEKYPSLHYKIYNNDAFYFEIDDDVDCIFMFNPFDDVVMSAVLENIEISLENNPRKMTIVYVNPMEKHVILEYDYKEIYHSKRMKYLEGSIFQKEL